MKAAVAKKYGDPLVIEMVNVPKVGVGQCLVKIKASGVCHTDLHAVNGDWPIKSILPLIPGHEGVGEVVEVGLGVSDVKVGDRVGIPWLFSSCGTCEFCQTGRETICETATYGGYSVNGGYAEYCVADAKYVGKIPASLSYEAAAPIMCAGVTTYKALKQTKASPGQWVAIYGIGGLGHLAVQYAKAMGFKVVAVDIDDKKLELAQKYGADMVVNSTKVESGKFIKAQMGGVQGAIVTAVSKNSFREAYDAIKNGGSLVAVALPQGSIELPIFETVLKEIHITGSLVGTRKDLQEALDLAGQGKVKAEYVLDKLENINDIFNKMKSGEIIGRTVMQLT
ncbi:propanol-preferring alcohol dehydrogenase [Entomoplasma freundtii]|uniref:Alcohol dehydrogenase n=1 Tax=Entomoplasma freundtii TaxID=74700 RepID=A0A2K8NSA8_9MOLU|nr:zinc-dependent alcohol dehydrogenase [Entomoplasma freundtii]TDY55966.1 propanol-preferring alcohol dehydrogenase [Entomoplasma freundtii]